MRLVCPAGSPPAFRAAIDAGADAVYLGFRDETNARAFPGLNFGEQDIVAAVTYAHARGRELYIALNTYPTPSRMGQWRAAVDRAARLGADAIIAADPALLDYAASAHPALPRHLSVQGSATTHVALRWYRERFGIARAVLPRVLSVEQVERVCAAQVVPIEVVAPAEGRPRAIHLDQKHQPTAGSAVVAPELGLVLDGVAVAVGLGRAPQAGRQVPDLAAGDAHRLADRQVAELLDHDAG